MFDEFYSPGRRKPPTSTFAHFSNKIWLNFATMKHTQDVVYSMGDLV